MESKIKIGDLRHLVILKKITTTPSDTGSAVETEQVFRDALWTKLDDVSGSESEEGKIIGLNVRKYTCRYDLEIVKNGIKMLITDVDGTYNVNSVAQIGFKSYLQLRCSKRE